MYCVTRLKYFKNKNGKLNLKQGQNPSFENSDLLIYTMFLKTKIDNFNNYVFQIFLVSTKFDNFNNYAAPYPNNKKIPLQLDLHCLMTSVFSRQNEKHVQTLALRVCLASKLFASSNSS